MVYNTNIGKCGGIRCGYATPPKVKIIIFITKLGNLEGIKNEKLFIRKEDRCGSFLSGNVYHSSNRYYYKCVHHKPL